MTYRVSCALVFQKKYSASMKRYFLKHGAPDAQPFHRQDPPRQAGSGLSCQTLAIQPALPDSGPKKLEHKGVALV